MVALIIRNAPEAVRDELLARPARSGRSSQEYVVALFAETAAHPSVEDVLYRARERLATTGSRALVADVVAARGDDRP